MHRDRKKVGGENPNFLRGKCVAMRRVPSCNGKKKPSILFHGKKKIIKRVKKKETLSSYTEERKTGGVGGGGGVWGLGRTVQGGRG